MGREERDGAPEEETDACGWRRGQRRGASSSAHSPAHRPPKESSCQQIGRGAGGGEWVPVAPLQTGRGGGRDGVGTAVRMGPRVPLRELCVA